MIDERGGVGSLALVVGVLCGGCDGVFGLSAESRPCEPTSFAMATAVDIGPANDFSINWDQTLAVIVNDGASFELALPGDAPLAIDLGAYSDAGLAVTPEGDALFYTAMVEPPLLLGALRAGPGAWKLDAAVPPGTYAGTPSADLFGPRRLLVKLRATSPDVQEYEDDDGTWKPIGDPHPIDGAFAPNLTPNGLTMVYAGATTDGTEAVLASARSSTSVWFGDPVVILPGAHRSAQLLGRCHQLYAVGSDQILRRYDE